MMHAVGRRVVRRGGATRRVWRAMSTGQSPGGSWKSLVRNLGVVAGAASLGVAMHTVAQAEEPASVDGVSEVRRRGALARSTILTTRTQSLSEHEDRLRRFSSPRALFEEHASARSADGSPMMTKRDFLRSFLAVKFGVSDSESTVRTPAAPRARPPARRTRDLPRRAPAKTWPCWAAARTG